MDFYRLTAQPESAKLLLGSKLIRNVDGHSYTCIITETEFYREDDPASHTFRGQTTRNQSMFLSSGHAYVYFIYGMHFCLNIVCGDEGYGAGVLLRGGIVDGVHVNGPARLTKALGINRELDGHNLRQSPLTLHLEATPPPERRIRQTTRVGISKATTTPWRYILHT